MQKYVIGIDLGGMSAKGALLDGDELKGISRCETNKNCTAEETASRLAALAREVAERAGIPFGQISSVGVGSPGVIDAKEGVVVRWTNFGWENVPLASLLERELSVPVRVLNDANAAALGEYEFGAGKSFSSAVMVTLGTGVGSGIVFDGKLFEGNKGAGAELGHTVIRAGGVMCSCGRRGCFEAYASATALMRETRAAMLRHPESVMWKLASSLDKVNGRTAFDGMRAGDPTASRVVKRYLKNLAEGLSNIANAFCPEAIVLGGGVSAEGETITKPLERIVNGSFIGGGFAPVKIVKASLGNDAGIYGAAAGARI